jgi:hypothetical protein
MFAYATSLVCMLPGLYNLTRAKYYSTYEMVFCCFPSERPKCGRRRRHWCPFRSRLPPQVTPVISPYRVTVPFVVERDIPVLLSLPKQLLNASPEIRPVNGLPKLEDSPQVQVYNHHCPHCHHCSHRRRAKSAPQSPRNKHRELDSNEAPDGKLQAVHTVGLRVSRLCICESSFDSTDNLSRRDNISHRERLRLAIPDYRSSQVSTSVSLLAPALGYQLMDPGTSTFQRKV